MKERLPTPPPGKYHSTKKGKKGYDRKIEKDIVRKEVKEHKKKGPA